MLEILVSRQPETWLVACVSPTRVVTFLLPLKYYRTDFYAAEQQHQRKKNSQSERGVLMKGQLGAEFYHMVLSAEEIEQ